MVAAQPAQVTAQTQHPEQQIEAAAAVAPEARVQVLLEVMVAQVL
jgi:hypothetical protein